VDHFGVDEMHDSEPRATGIDVPEQRLMLKIARNSGPVEDVHSDGPACALPSCR